MQRLCASTFLQGIGLPEAVVMVRQTVYVPVTA